MLPYSVSDLKLIAIAIISFGSYFFGILPNLLGLGSKLQGSVILSSVLSFGGGVLFATSMVHILPDIRKDLSDWSEPVFCIGYMLIYFTDVVIALLTKKDQHIESPACDHPQIQQNRNYGSTSEDATVSENHYQLPVLEIPNGIKCLDLSLLFAFSLHSLLEGLVIGVESTQSGVLLLLMAVCCHKLLVAFCLGAELSSAGQPLFAILPALSVFVAGSAAGIFLGIVLHPDDSPVVAKIIPVLQGLAGGTLLYVVFTEILPRERARKLPVYSAIIQYISFCIGFIFLSCLSIIT